MAKVKVKGEGFKPFDVDLKELNLTDRSEINDLIMDTSVKKNFTFWVDIIRKGTSFAEDDPSTFITEHDHGKCINFHPSNNYDVFSICGWVKAKYISENGFLIDNRYDADTGWVVFANDTGGNFKFKIGDGTDTVTIDSGANLTLDTWHHLVVTYSGNAGSIKMYFDGVCKIVNGTATNVAVLTSLSNLENIQTVVGGRSFGDIENGFHGQIDDVLYYNKVLSDGGVSDEATAKGEIARIYNAGKRSHK